MYKNYFKDKIVLVTGGGSGIGRAVCQKLAEAGAVVLCTDIDLKKANETVALVGNDKAHAQQLDVADLSAIEKTIAGLVSECGRIDLVFNNAGIAISGEIRDLNMADWKRIIDTNLYGVLYGSQTAYQYMLTQGSGQIVNTASVAGLVDYLSMLAPYSLTKHAVVDYTKILRLEAKAFGIKANVICPGFINTPIAENSSFVNADQGWREDGLATVAAGLNVEKAANYILKGVAANKEVIIFPAKALAILQFTKLFKGLYKLAIIKNLEKYRKTHRIN
jgi:NAD(P)-dependent dehydrogenase (short-subunit alcohol dehydrogenase family)